MFTFKDVADNVRNYREICELFFSLADNDNIRDTLKSILYDGKVGDYVFYNDKETKKSFFVEASRRISMAKLFLKEPETFDYFIQHRIHFFHGTNSRALSSILNNGIISFKNLKNRNENITTGETFSSNIMEYESKDFISFTSVFDIAEGYSTLYKTEMDFEVIIGTTDLDISQVRIDNKFQTNYPEVGVLENFPVECIKVICVPSSKINLVKNLIGTLPIMVLPYDNMDKNFYNLEFDGPDLEILEEEFLKFKNELHKNKNDEKKKSLLQLRSLLLMFKNKFNNGRGREK